VVERGHDYHVSRGLLLITNVSLMRDALLEIWRNLMPPAVRGELAGRRAPALPANRSVFVAIERSGRKHVLVRLPQSQEPLQSTDARGLQVTTAIAQIGDNPRDRYIDILCLDPSQDRLFATLGEDLIESLSRSASPENEVVLQTIARWRAFWTVKSAGFTLEQAIGLFGELWFFQRWLGSDAAQAKWMQTLGARHDFQWNAASVEVKTAQAASVATATHHIVSLDQLDDPATGQLYLFSLLILEDALSTNTLEALISRISSELEPDPVALASFRQKLASYGFVPSASPFSSRPIRVIREALYIVRTDFPRLTRQTFSSGVPPGIGDIQYTLAVSACEPWLVASLPTDTASAFLRSD